MKPIVPVGAMTVSGFIYTLVQTNPETGGQVQIALDNIQVIPAGGTLLVSVPQETNDADFELIRQQIREQFGPKSAVTRAGELQFFYIGQDDAESTG
jgi:hypothetical protein